MSSHKVAPGHYVIDGVAIVKRNRKQDLSFADGWNLIVNGEWWNTFATKAEAIEAFRAESLAAVHAEIDQALRSQS